MAEVVVGVVLTAVIGGLLVPAVKAHIDRRRERFKVSSDLLETLAASLWTYWKLAMRVAYYGRKAPAFREDYAAALKAWDSTEAWDNGARIQIQISQSKLVLPKDTHKALNRAQQAVVDDLDRQVADLRERQDTTAWETFYKFLWGPRRDQIHELLFSLTQHLALAQQAWLIRRWRTSVKAQLLSTMAIVAFVGIAVIVIGVSAGGGLGTWIAVLGVVAVMLAGVCAIETMRWLRPSTRLPEHLRNSVPVAAWRRSPVTLQLRDGTRVRCVAVRPGGYVPPRKTDPRFDAREVTVMTTSTEADCTTERERQAQQKGA
jgi:hypothetical protein